MMLGGGALGLLALGGAAFAVTRRRRNDEVMDDTTMDETVAAEPAPLADPVYEEQPAIVEPSAFDWGHPKTAEPPVEAGPGQILG